MIRHKGPDSSIGGRFALKSVAFFVALLLLIFGGWRVHYSGEPLAEYDGTVVVPQLARSRVFSIAKVRLEVGDRFSADCPGKRQNERVVVLRKRGVLFDHTLYQCKPRH